MVPLSLALLANAPLEISSARLLWDPTLKETIHTPALQLDVRFHAHHLNSGPMSAIPCNRTSSTVLHAREAESVTTVFAKAPALAKRFRAGSRVTRR